MKRFIVITLVLILLFLVGLFIFADKSYFSSDYEISLEDESIENNEEINKAIDSFYDFETETSDPEDFSKLEEEEIIQEYKTVEKIPTPSEVRALYLTSNSAGLESRVSNFIEMVKRSEINSLIIDVNGFSGFVAYDSNLKEVENSDIEDIRIPDLRGLIKRLHDNGIYTIARITVFQDLAYAEANPELAIKSIETGELWKDYGGQAWLDPSSKEAWDYKLALAKEVSSMGFDELNFDYIRFPSDGNLRDTKYPFWDEVKPQKDVMKDFFAFLRENLSEEVISADLFGLTTINYDDLGIGQVLEDAFPHFDFIAPMVYPSHYADGFLNYENPAEQPYGVIYFSMWKALTRLNTYKNINPDVNVKLRPWIQDFNLGANYNEFMVGIQIKATKDSLGNHYNGFMVWDPSNIYTIGALRNN
ncbi:MAG: putative glycoside hydrolase [Candidatus Paceibacterota bacterium]